MTFGWNYPPGVTGNEPIFYGPPDEPTHMYRCPDCHCFLKHYEWDYMEERDDSGLYTAWFTQCKGCGRTIIDRG